MHLKAFQLAMGILAFLPVQYANSETVIVSQNEASASCNNIPIDGGRYITLCDIPEAAVSSSSGVKQEQTDKYKYLSEATGTVTIMNLAKEDGCCTCQSAAPVIIIMNPSAASKASMPSIIVAISLLLVHHLC